MAEDHVPLALVRPRRRLSLARYLRFDDQVAELVLQGVEAVNPDHRAAALTAQVRCADREAALRWREVAEYLETRPRRIHVDVVCVGEQGGELRSGRTRRNLTDGDIAAGTPEPLHVGQPGTQPERAQAAQPVGADRSELLTGDVAGEQDGPLDPRVLEHLEGGRQVLRDRVPDQ